MVDEGDVVIGLFVVAVSTFVLGFLLSEFSTESRVVDHLSDVTIIEDGVTCKGWKHENMTFYVCDDDTTKVVNDDSD